jgi:hypothetical protein
MFCFYEITLENPKAKLNISKYLASFSFLVSDRFCFQVQKWAYFLIQTKNDKLKILEYNLQNGILRRFACF